MHVSKNAISATVLCLALGASGTFAAQASEPPTVLGCVHMAKKFDAAMSSAQASANTDAAREQSRLAQGLCDAHQFKQGVEVYAKTLQMLGAG